MTDAKKLVEAFYAELAKTSGSAPLKEFIRKWYADDAIQYEAGQAVEIVDN